MKFIIVLFLLLTCLPSLAMRFQLDGLDESLQKKLLQEFPEIEDEMRDFSLIDQVIRFLMETGDFQTVEVLEMKGDKLQISASPIQRVNQIVFDGNRALSNDELARVSNISLDSKYDSAVFVEAIERLKEHYANKGFRGANIDFQADQGTFNRVNVKLKVIEGQPTRLRKISFLSANENLNQRLSSLTQGYLDKTFSLELQKEIDEEIQEFLRKNRFLRTRLKVNDATVSEDGFSASLQLEVINPYYYQFFFEGNDEGLYTDQFLRRRILSSSFATATKEPAEFVADLIRQEYFEKGYALATVTGAEQLRADLFRKDILVDIEEGVPTRIDQISLIGLFSRPSKYYVDFIRQSGSDLLSKGFYNREQIRTGIESLRNELNNQGYLNAKIQVLEENFNEDSKGVEVRISLNEGPLTQIQAVRFIGNTDFSRQELLKVVQLEVNTALRLDQLAQKIEQLKNFYRHRGYLEMNLENPGRQLIEYSPSLTEASIVFKIYEGPKISVSQVLVEGNYRTKTSVILQELEFSRGETLTPEKIIESQKRLFRLGTFSEVRIDTLEKNSMTQKRVVVIQVKEGKPQTIRFGAGITDERDFTARGYVAYSHNNLGGQARVFAARAEANSNIGDINYLERDLSFSFTERLSFWQRTSLRSTVANTTNVIDVEGNEVTISETTDFTFQFENPLTSSTTLFFRLYDLSLQRTYERDDQFEADENVIAQLGPSIEFDYRDNIFNPRSGSFSRLNIRYGDPVLGSSDGIQFYKVTGRTTHYWPIWKKLTWVNSLRGGYLKSLSNDPGAGVPAATEGFFLGGRSTIRGFDSLGERFPREEELGVSDLTDFFVTDFSSYGLYKTEFRFPLFGSVGGAIFYDGGAVFVDGVEFDDAYRDSVGFGIQIATPVGPVNFEIGFKLDRKESLSEDPWRFHFSIGSF